VYRIVSVVSQPQLCAKVRVEQKEYSGLEGVVQENFFRVSFEQTGGLSGCFLQFSFSEKRGREGFFLVTRAGRHATRDAR